MAAQVDVDRRGPAVRVEDYSSVATNGVLVDVFKHDRPHGDVGFDNDAARLLDPVNEDRQIGVDSGNLRLRPILSRMPKTGKS